MLFDVTQKFARDQKLDVSGVSELSWRTSTWEKLVLADDEEVIKLMKEESLRILRFCIVRWKNTRIHQIQCRMKTSNFVV